MQRDPNLFVRNKAHNPLWQFSAALDSRILQCANLGSVIYAVRAAILTTE
jgi:hypothetical protein